MMLPWITADSIIGAFTKTVKRLEKYADKKRLKAYRLQEQIDKKEEERTQVWAEQEKALAYADKLSKAFLSDSGVTDNDNEE